MHSELFQLGPVTIYSYGLCMALGFLCAWQAAVWLCKRSGQSADRLTSMVTLLMITAVFGARAAYVIEHWNAEFAGSPAAILRFDQGGLMFYGGFITASIFVIAYISIKKINLFEISDILLSVLPLGHAFGRIGCFMHGCCYGRITKCACGVGFPSHSPAWSEQTRAGLIADNALRSLPVLPTQLIESAANLALFAVMLAVFLRYHRQRGFATGIYLISYAVLRFLIEFLRGDPRASVGVLSISQTIGIGLAAAGLCALAYSRKNRTPESAPNCEPPAKSQAGT